MKNNKTKRIYLRPIAPQDAPALFTYRADPKIYKYQTWQPHTMEDVHEFIAHRIVNKPDIPGTWYQQVICKIENDEIIGDCGLHFLKEMPTQVEIGITIKQTYQKRGYARETLELIFTYTFEKLKKHRIIALVDPGNISSIRLLEHMKMRREVYNNRHVGNKSQKSDDITYVISAKEWKQKKNG